MYSLCFNIECNICILYSVPKVYSVSKEYGRVDSNGNLVNSVEILSLTIAHSGIHILHSWFCFVLSYGFQPQITTIIRPKYTQVLWN